jgi:hypothetical protein
MAVPLTEENLKQEAICAVVFVCASPHHAVLEHRIRERLHFIHGHCPHVTVIFVAAAAGPLEDRIQEATARGWLNDVGYRDDQVKFLKCPSIGALRERLSLQVRTSVQLSVNQEILNEAQGRRQGEGSEE